MKHIMIDLETLSTAPDAVITDIAAIEFDPRTGETGAKFLQRPYIQDSIDLGFRVDVETLIFRADHAPVIDGYRPIDGILSMFSDFIEKIKGNEHAITVWSNGAGFDLPILRYAYLKCHLPLPFDYWAERCVRTIAALAPNVKKSTPFEGTPHHPLDDCLYQIKYLVKTAQKLDLLL